MSSWQRNEVERLLCHFSQLLHQPISPLIFYITYLALCKDLECDGSKSPMI